MSDQPIPIPARVQDLTNHPPFDRLTVIEFVGINSHHQSLWRCRCSCAAQTIIVTRGGDLRQGKSRSCGCRVNEIIGDLRRTHGMSKTPEYNAWLGMIARCENENAVQFMDWGGRGISIYPPWRKSFEEFFAYVGERPSSAHSIDRYPNPNGNYEPGNARWATRTEQNRNRRNAHILVFDGRSMSIAEWAEHLQVRQSLIRDRIRRGWSVERALKEPARIQ